MKYTPDFSSRFRILKGGKISLVVSALIAGSTMSFASPSGGQVTSGSASIAQNGSITTINQSSNKASINWNSFSIAPSETVNFVQPSSQSVTLNRVVGTTQSLIQGAMNANGQVFLLNPNGVLFANGSQVNVGGLVASTLNITDAAFQAGNYVFEGNSQNSIINMGTITANNGYVAMMGKHVANEGTIVATMGNVQLASGEKISLNLNGNSLVKLTIDQGTLNALIENKGLIQADGGQVYLTTQALNTILDGMVNNTGVIEAKTLNDVTGKVVLFAHGGTANISGTIDASGGFVETSGDKVKIADDINIKSATWLIDPTDFTVAATGGDISGAVVSAYLENNGDMLIASTAGATQGNGDIFINDAISWSSSHYLRLTANRDININDTISLGDNAPLYLDYGNGGKITFGMNAAKDDFVGKITFATNNTVSINNVSQTVINDAAALQAMQSDLSGNYVLASNIDLTGVTWTPIGSARNNNTYDMDFIGSFNGLGHTVSNLTISGAFQYDDNSGLGQSAGMFGNIATTANISSIRLSNASVTNTADNSNNWDNYTGSTGTLVGYARADGQQTYTPIIHNNIVTGSSVSSTGDGNSVGGVVGSAFGVAISNNAVTHTNVTSNKWSAGGIVGVARSQVADKSTIKNSYVADSTIKSAFGEVGGVAGYVAKTTVDGATVKNSLIQATSALGGSYGAGGIVGVAEEASKIKNAAAEGNTIAAMQDVGGIVGYLEDSNYDLEGDEPSTVTNSFYKLDNTKIGTNLATPSNNSAGVITYGGIYAAEYAAWLAGNKADLSAATFLGAATNGYYSIDNLADFKSMIALAYNPANNFKLAASFALDAGLYMPVLTGILDGNGKTITGLSVSQGYNSHIGLVGRLMGGTVKNLTLAGATLDGYAYVGGVAGYAGGRDYVTYGDRAELENFPTISNVTVTGLNYSHTKVFDTTTQNIDTYVSNIGAIAGYAEGATLSNLSATGSITATLTANNEGYDSIAFNNIGGLFGALNNSSLDTATSAVTITADMSANDYICSSDSCDNNSVGTYSIGGLVGSAYADIVQNATASGAIDLTLAVNANGVDIEDNNYYSAYASIESVGGLFGYISDSYVKTASATNPITLNTNDDIYSVGGIAGYSGDSLFDTVTTSGLISTDGVTIGGTKIFSNDQEYIGGMIGESSSDIIKNAASTRNITLKSDLDDSYIYGIGGLVGYAEYSNISDSSYTGTIDVSTATSGENIGGLVGYNRGEIDYLEQAYFGKMIAAVTPADLTGTDIETTKAAMLVAYNERADVIALKALGYTVEDDSWGNTGEPYYAGFKMKSPDNTEWGVIKNSMATVNIKAPNAENVGGLVGYMDASDGGQIINSSVAALSGTGKVLGGSNVGGLVGYNYYGNITDSHAAIEVVGNTDYDGSNIGGLVGYNEGSSRTEYLNVQNIHDSFHTTQYATQQEAEDALATVKQAYIDSLLEANPGYEYDVSDWDISVTQLWGQEGFYIYGQPDIIKNQATGTITNSYATGKVTGGENVGGLVGYNYGEDGGAAITSSHSIGVVSGTDSVGGLVGYAGGSEISNSYHTTGKVSSVSGGDYIGGLVGQLDGGSIADSYATSEVEGYGLVGGLVGYGQNAHIEQSYATGKVTGAEYVGGLVGQLLDAPQTVINSYATGEVIGVNYVGGLVGEASGSTIETSYAKGKVTGANDVGGLVGKVDNSSTISNVYSNGDVSGSGDNVGGLIGAFDGSTLTNSYASGKITQTGTNQINVNGLIGTLDGDVVASFYNNTKNVGMADEADFGKTTAEMNTLATFSDAGWDIVEDSSLTKMFPQFASSGSIWKINPVATIDPGVAGEVTPEPTPTPVVEQQQQVVNNIVTTIVNSTTVTPPAPIVIVPVSAPQQVQTQAQNNAMLQSVLPQDTTNGGTFNLVGSTDGTTPVQTITMEQLQGAATTQGVGEIRVPLGTNSMVELVNGGVNLPSGVSQEFYVVAANDAGTNSSTGSNRTTGSSDKNKKSKKN